MEKYAIELILSALVLQNHDIFLEIFMEMSFSQNISLANSFFRLLIFNLFMLLSNLHHNLIPRPYLFEVYKIQNRQIWKK